MSISIAASKRKYIVVFSYQSLEECLPLLKLSVNIFLEKGSVCCLVSVTACQVLCSIKHVNNSTHTEISFQLWSPGIRSATVGQSLEQRLASVFRGQILPCVVISEFMVITLWRQLSAGFISSQCCTTS